jgi:hypothetical protein
MRSVLMRRSGVRSPRAVSVAMPFSTARGAGCRRSTSTSVPSSPWASLGVRYPSGLVPSAARQIGAPRLVVRPLSLAYAGPSTLRE